MPRPGKGLKQSELLRLAHLALRAGLGGTAPGDGPATASGGSNGCGGAAASRRKNKRVASSQPAAAQVQPSLSPAAVAPGALSPAAAVDGWVEIRPKRRQEKSATATPAAAPAAVASASTASAATTVSEELLQEGWSVPVSRTPCDLKADVPGIALAASRQEVLAAIVELAHASAAVAVLSPSMVDGRGVAMVVPVIVQGRILLRQRFLIQLGIGIQAVTFTPPAAKLSVRDDTTVLVMEMAEELAPAMAWQAAMRAPGAALRRWLGAHGVDSMLDSWGASRAGGEPGKRVCRVFVRIAAAHLDAALAASGADGVFIRPYFTDEAQRLAHKIVWLPSGTSLEAALRQASRSEGSVGLVRNARGLGVRVPTVAAPAVALFLLGAEAAEQVTGEVWELAGLPMGCSKIALTHALTEWGWKGVTLLRHVSKGQSRSWFARAACEPPGRLLQHSSGLVTVQLATRRAPTQQAPQQRWQPPREGAGRPPTTLPGSWAELVAGSLPAPRRAADAVVRTPAATACAARNAAPTEQRAMDVDTAAAAGAGNAAASAGNGAAVDLAALVAAAIAQALGPLHQQLQQMQTQLNSQSQAGPASSTQKSPQTPRPKAKQGDLAGWLQRPRPASVDGARLRSASRTPPGGPRVH
jgi:hypothetical protein